MSVTLGCACDVVASPRDSALSRVTELLCNVMCFALVKEGFACYVPERNIVTYSRREMSRLRSEHCHETNGSKSRRRPVTRIE